MATTATVAKATAAATAVPVAPRPVAAALPAVAPRLVAAPHPVATPSNHRYASASHFADQDGERHG